VHTISGSIHLGKLLIVRLVLVPTMTALNTTHHHWLYLAEPVSQQAVVFSIAKVDETSQFLIIQLCDDIRRASITGWAVVYDISHFYYR
jgi:hypothetical protein